MVLPDLSVLYGQLKSLPGPCARELAAGLADLLDVASRWALFGPPLSRNEFFHPPDYQVRRRRQDEIEESAILASRRVDDAVAMAPDGFSEVHRLPEILSTVENEDMEAFLSQCLEILRSERRIDVREAGGQMPVASESKPAKKRSTLTGPALDAAAAAVLSEHPDWNRAQIARHLKVDKRRISDCAKLPGSKLLLAEQHVSADRAERRERLADFERREGLAGTDE